VSHLLRSERDTERAGALLAEHCRPGDFVALEGDLGAGKTCLVRGLVDRLGLIDAERVTSPTFALIHRYRVRGPLKEVAHIDLYRLQGVDELESTGYWDVVAEAGLTVVEWIDRIPAAVASREPWWLRLSHRGDTRVLEVVEGPEGRVGAVRAALEAALLA